jgi:hypothetical protein
MSTRPKRKAAILAEQKIKEELAKNAEFYAEEDPEEKDDVTWNSDMEISEDEIRPWQKAAPGEKDDSDIESSSPSKSATPTPPTAAVSAATTVVAATPKVEAKPVVKKPRTKAKATTTETVVAK